MSGVSFDGVSTYTATGGGCVFQMDTTGTFTFNLSGNGTSVYFNPSYPSNVSSQTGNTSFEDANNTQTIEYLYGKFTSTGLIGSTQGTKSVFVHKETALTVTNYTNIPTMYIGGSGLAAITTVTGSGIIYVGCDNSLRPENTANLTITTPASISIVVVGSYCTIAVSGCSSITINSGAVGTTIVGTGNTIVNSAGAAYTRIVGTQTSVTDSGTATTTSATGSSNPTSGTFGNLALSGNTLSSTTGGVTITPNGSNAISLSNQTLVTPVTGSTSTGTGALVVSGGVGIAGNTYIGGNLIVGGNQTSGTNTGDQTFSITGEVTAASSSSVLSATLSNAAVIGKVLTGYVSGAGTVSATDSILSAIQKLNGNISVGLTGSGVSNRIPYYSAATVLTNSANLTYDGTTLTANSLSLAGTTIASTTTNGSINILPNGTGEVLLKADPVSLLGASTKQYVDSSDQKRACRVKATSLPSFTAAGSGVGKTLTGSAVGVLTVDGVALVLNDRVLVDLSTSNSGIYYVSTAGTASVAFVLTRSTDADTSSKVRSGMQVYISEGTSFGSKLYILSTTGAITIDTTAMTFTPVTSAGGSIAHSSLTGLTVGDDHTQYLLLAGRTGGQSIANTISFTNNTTASSANTASVTFAGGVGIAGNIYITGNNNLAGQVIMTNATTSTSASTGALVVQGGVGVTGNSYYAGITTFTNSTPASSATTGTIVVTGGIGIGGNTYCSGVFNVTNSSNASSGSSGAIVVSGGIGVAGNSYFAGTVTNAGVVTVNNNTNSTSTNSGALVLNGSASGLGMTGNLYVGGTANFAGVVNATNSTASSSVSTGAIVVSGGIGVTGNSTFGGNVTLTTSANNSITTAGGISIAGNIASSGSVMTFTGGSSTTGLTIYGSTAASGNLTLSSTSNGTKGSVIISDSTASTASNNGALVVTGGIGVSGNSYYSGLVNFTNSSNNSLTMSGGLTIAGNIISSGTTFGITGGSGNMTIIGSTGANGNLILQSTSNGTKGNVQITENTASTSSTTGALVVTGGIGVSGASYFSGILNSSNNSNNSVSLAGGITMGGNIFSSGSNFSINGGSGTSGLTIIGSTSSGGNLTLQSTSNTTKGSVLINESTVSTSSTTGALVVTGGIGVSSASYFSSTVNITNNNNGALTVSGGITIGSILAGSTSLTITGGSGTSGMTIIGSTAGNGNLTLQSTSSSTKGSVLINENTASTSSTTGALVVTGGVGVGSTLFAGTSIISPTHAGSANSGGTMIIQSTTNASKATAGILMNDGIASSSTGTGTLVVTGGVGVSGNLYAGALFSGGNAVISSITLTGGVTGTYSAGSIATTLTNSSVIGQVLTGFTSGAGTVTSSDTILTAFQKVVGNTGTYLTGSGTAGYIPYYSSSIVLTNSANLTYSGTVLTIGNSTASTSTTTGALVVTGGIGIGGNANIGGSITSAGAVTVTNNTNSSSTTTGALILSGAASGLGMTGNLNVGGSGVISNITVSSSSISCSGTNADLTLATNGTGRVLLSGDPTSSLHAATKNYVDTIDYHRACRLRATALPSFTAAGTGTGKTLTGSSVGILTIDSVNTVLGDRILVDLNTSNSGVYTVTTAGTASVAFVLTRATDFDMSTEIRAGATFYIQEGTVNAGRYYTMSTVGTITVDTTTLVFAQLNGNTITLTGDVTGSGTTSIATTVSNATVIGKLLTGYTSGAGTITSSDSILTAIQKLNGNTALALTGSGTANYVPYYSSSLVLTNSANLTYSGTVFTIGNSTASTSTTTGALVVTGGVGVGGAVNIAGSTITPTLSGSSSASGTLTLQSTSNATKATAGILMTDGIAASSTTTGTLVVTGGIGASGAIYAGSMFSGGTAVVTGITLTGGVTGTYSAGSIATTLTNSSVIGQVLTGFTSGAGTVTSSDTILTAFQKVIGNAASFITGSGTAGYIPYYNSSLVLTNSSNLTYSGTVLTIGNSTAASSTTTGALVVTGGIGVGGTAYLNAVNTNTINGTTTNGDISILPNGTGHVLVNAAPTIALGVATKGYVDTLLPSATLLSSAIAYWDGINNPTTTNFSSPTATLSGAAVYLSTTEGVRLTLDGVGSSSGAINFNFNQVAFMRVQFRFKITAAGSPADAVWFYCYADGIPTTEYGTGITNGYILAFSSYHQNVELNWGVGADAGGGAGFVPGNNLAFSSNTGLASGTWRDADIYINQSRVVIYLDGAKVIDYQDVYTRSMTGMNFGFAARTGGQTATQQVRGFVVTKLGDDPNLFNINNLTPLTSGLVWDRPNGRLGVNTTAPGYTLDITGTLNVSSTVTLAGNVTSTATTNTITGGSAAVGLTIIGSTASGGDLVLQSTSNATKGNVQITESTAATSSTTGALTVTGGVGVGGSVYAGNLQLTSNTISNSTANTDLAITANGTGRVLLSADPTSNLHASTKQYVDNLFTRVTYTKSALQNITSNTTLTNDSNIAAIPITTGTYLVRGTLFATTTSSGINLKIAFTLTTATASNMRIAMAKLVGTASNQLFTASGTASSVITLASNEQCFMQIDGTMVVSGTGTFALQWAQFTTSSTAMTMQQGSYLQVTKIA